MVWPSSLVLLISISVDSSAMASSCDRAPVNRSILSKTWRRGRMPLLTQSGHRPLSEPHVRVATIFGPRLGCDDEATRVHQASWRGGNNVAARDACAAAFKTGDRISRLGASRDLYRSRRGISVRSARFRLRRGHEHHHPISLCRGALRAAFGFGE